MSCRKSYHDELRRTWNVEPLGEQHGLDVVLELGNCRECHSTLAREKPKGETK